MSDPIIGLWRRVAIALNLVFVQSEIEVLGPDVLIAGHCAAQLALHVVLVLLLEHFLVVNLRQVLIWTRLFQRTFVLVAQA